MGLIRDGILSVVMFLAGSSAHDIAYREPQRVTYVAYTTFEEPYRELSPEVVRDDDEVRDDSIGAALARSAWPPHLWHQVLTVAHCESGFNPLAVGDRGLAWGLMQVRADAHPWLARHYDLFTPDGNLAAAWELYQDSGWRPWSCKP